MNFFIMTGSFQLLACSICGYFHVRHPIGFLSSQVKKVPEVNPSFKAHFTKSLVLIGCLRFVSLFTSSKCIGIFFDPINDLDFVNLLSVNKLKYCDKDIDSFSLLHFQIFYDSARSLRFMVRACLFC